MTLATCKEQYSSLYLVK